MKVAVINFSGNVGKTTVAGQMLKPRMGNARIFSIESINNDASGDGIEVERIRGKKFRELQNQLMQLDSAIVDVGDSNVEEFLKTMQQVDQSHDVFDLFIVPVVKEKKQQRDTVNTIRALADIGIPANKVRLLFNNLDVDESVLDEFPAIIGTAGLEQNCIADIKAVIYSNEVYDLIKPLGRSVDEIAKDPVDYRSKLRELTNKAERDECIEMVGIKGLARTANKNLDDAFAAVTADA
jgi:RNA-binding protein YhbY